MKFDVMKGERVMRTLRVALMAVLFAVSIFAASADAQYPSYLLSRAPVATRPHHPGYGYYPGYEQSVAPRPYAYGWFGAKPYPQWSRHSGYYRNYTEWSSP